MEMYSSLTIEIKCIIKICVINTETYFINNCFFFQTQDELYNTQIISVNKIHVKKYKMIFTRKSPKHNPQTSLNTTLELSTPINKIRNIFFKYLINFPETGMRF